MSTLLNDFDQTSSFNGSTHAQPDFTTMPSHVHVRNSGGRMRLPHPRPTVSLDPRPVVIPILTSVIGFPIIVFALICALRHRAIKLRRKDQQKKLQSGVRSVTLDIPAREKISFFSGGSSPEISIREMGDKYESTQISYAGLNTIAPAPTPKPSILNTNKKVNPSSKNNNHVKFITPATTLDASHTMKVEAVLHTIAAAAAGSIGAEINGLPWKNEEKQSSVSIDIEMDSTSEYTPR